jgi:hypothetical protein
MARKYADILNRFSYLAPVFAAALAATACGGGDGGEDPEQGGGGSGATGGSTSNNTNTNTSTGGSCRTDALFTARTYGDSGDLIRHIVRDESNGDILFSVLGEIFVLRAGASEPEKLGDRPVGSSPLRGNFTLRDNKLYFPSNSIPVEGRLPVLFEMDRSGGEPRVTASMAAGDPLDVFQMVRTSTIVGNDIVWFDEYAEREFNGGLAPSTYRGRRTSLSSPGEPEVWFESATRITPVAVSGTQVFIEVDDDDTLSAGSQQKVVNIADGSVASMSAEERYGGRIVAADERSLFVSVFDLSDLSRVEENGIFRVAPDGSGRQRVARFGAIETGLGNFVNIAHRGDLWALDDGEPENGRQALYVYEVGSEPRRVGCVDNKYSIHDIAIGDGELLVSVFEGASYLATIFRFEI